MELAILLTAIAALLTSIITSFTLHEMRRQREVSHLPILKVLSEYVLVEISKNENWLWENERLKISNFGKGVALDVKVQWEVKIDEILTMLKKYDPHNVKDISFENDILKLEDSVHMVKRQSEAFFPAIPVNTVSDNELSIPSYITTTFGKFINEAILNIPDGYEKKSINCEDFPIIDIKISYRDINNNEYKKNFSLSINLSYIKKHSENDSGDAAIVFDANEISA